MSAQELSAKWIEFLLITVVFVEDQFAEIVVLKKSIMTEHVMCAITN